ncbi:unnamed protein product [Oikopleura dioica]|uniref:NADH dehydrogenase [ubiquinone] 1 alpha subcomplex subunit 7 n=1 Tax=Oikopleura dioica TaxID=34765 RepID=E4YE82_OIKDI|nr:unnamed protein product [Oikopleura dioica]CBY36971.1 unnamed protein product [Oikopleura dioica]
MQLSRLLLKQRSQTPFNIWMTQFLGGRTDPEYHYMRYEYQQAPRTYAPRVKPPGENEKLHSVTYIYRDERRKVKPPMIVSNVVDATTREVTGRPTPGFGLKWSLNSESPVIRQHSATFGLEPGYKGYRNNEFYKE